MKVPMYIRLKYGNNEEKSQNNKKNIHTWEES